jgi:penicillin amidase
MPDRLHLHGESLIEIERDAHGVPHVRASTEPDLYRGLGFCHGHDRALPTLLMRIVGQGRASEVLDGSDDVLRADRRFRAWNFSAGASAEVDRMDARDRARLEAYCAGVNQALERRVPWELRWLGYTPEPWRSADSVLISRLAGFVSLAQTQGDVERLFVELAQAGVPLERLEELFPVTLSPEDLEILRRVVLGERLLPDIVRWGAFVPKAVASNNWVIAPARSATGHAILANDPHLETNRLPAVWYEAVLELGDRFCIAATMPGLPGLLLGRTNDLAWGATYTFMDALDSWIEDCRDGRYRRIVDGRESWLPFTVRRETIRRKGKPPFDLVVYENEHGVLEGDPEVAGLYVATRWSAGAGTGARSLAGSFEILWARDVEEGRAAVGKVETAWNWVLADRRGNIAYQMSGLMPVRRPGWNGFAPQPGWDPDNDWRGFATAEELPRALNPACGYLVTANDDLNRFGRRAPINVAMGSYRAERIASLLAESSTWTVEDVARLQLDEFSLQAARLLPLLAPHLPDGPVADLLRGWDCCYETGSRAAPIFEEIYRELVSEVLGLGGAAEALLAETSILADFYDSFDRILLNPRSAWFGREGRAALFGRVVRRVAERIERRGTAVRWGDCQQITLSHLLLGGRLPVWAGFDYGPIGLPGGRATVRQGQVYRSGGRTTSFAPSYRLVTDLGEDVAHTALAGGPSDRRFSSWYASGLEAWRAGKLKTLRPERRAT